jgi:hypothetical protein
VEEFDFTSEALGNRIDAEKKVSHNWQEKLGKLFKSAEGVREKIERL